jgi:hypothetical protein
MAGEGMTFVGPLTMRTVAQSYKLGNVPFFNYGRVKTLHPILGEFDSNGHIHTNDDRVNYEWNERVMGTPLGYSAFGPPDPFELTGSYNDPNDAIIIDQIDQDGNAAVDLAVRYLVTGNLDALNGAIEILKDWSVIHTFMSSGNEPLTWASRWPKFLQATQMLQHTEQYTDSLHAALVDVTTRGLEITPSWRPNNWGNWGVCLDIASASFLGDKTRFKIAVMRWREIFNSAIVNNVPVLEIYRQGNIQVGDGSTGLFYSKFALDAMAVGAEWARFNGEWLYDFVGLDGSSFKGLYENIRHWARYPDQYPYNTSGTPSVTTYNMAYDDILHALWPHEESQWMLDNFPEGFDSRDVYGMRQWVLAYRYRELYG